MRGQNSSNILGTTVTNQNSIHKEIKGRLKSGNACYHSVFATQKYEDLDIQNYNVAGCFDGFETWSLTVEKVHRFRVFKNKLPRISGPKRDEVTREVRSLHNVEPHYLYSSPNIIQLIKSRRVRWAEHAAHMGDRCGVYTVLVRRLEGKRELGKPRCKWEDNIKMDLEEVGCGRMDWIELDLVRDWCQALLN
jgi:hypothetical protein